MNSLLPLHHEEFQSKEYWERFFRERKEEAFEWYGIYSDISPYLRKHLKLDNKCLVIGCGNSEFSNNLYDDGFHNITNIDFSPLVISEMSTKSSHRHHMSWEVMDMTSMTFELTTFDIIFDKGALDALMSDDSSESIKKAELMFREINRIANPGGKYICITLAQDYILNKLLTTFNGFGWHLRVDIIKKSQSESAETSPRTTPFRPFIFIFTKPHSQPSETAKTVTTVKSPLITISFDAFGSDLPRMQLTTIATIQEKVLAVQQFARKQFDLQSLKPGRYDILQIHSTSQPSATSSSPTGPSQNGAVVSAEIPRFTLYVLDLPDDDESYHPIRVCAVFLVPRGREAEYQFCSEHGLYCIARQASCRRLIAVTCNRPHQFPLSTQDLQAELSPVVLSVCPYPAPPPDTIPFLAVGDDEGWEAIKKGNSVMSGNFVIEESEDENKPNVLYRRLIFLQNQQFIQTEVKLIKQPTSKASKRNEKKNKNKKPSPKDETLSSTSTTSRSEREMGGGEEPILELDLSSIDAHHAAVLASMSLSPDILQHLSTASADATTLKEEDNTDNSNSNTGDTSVRTDAGRVLIVGLGGGVFPMTARRYFPAAKICTVELDPEVESIAIDYFGYKPDHQMLVHIGDGVEFLINNARTAPKTNDSMALQALLKETGTSESAIVKSEDHTPCLEVQKNDLSRLSSGSNSRFILYSLIFIDADSKDPSLGMSAPPAAFMTDEAIRAMYTSLEDGGVLALNVVARAQHLQHRLEKALIDVFVPQYDGENPHSIHTSTTGSVYRLKASEENVNVTLLCVKGERRKVLPKESSSASRRKVIMDWLKRIGQAQDPLELSDLVNKLEAVS